MDESYNNVSEYGFPVLTEMKKKYDNYKDEWFKTTYDDVQNKMKDKEVIFLFSEDKDKCTEDKECYFFESYYIQDGKLNESALLEIINPIEISIELKRTILDLAKYSCGCSLIQSSHETIYEDALNLQKYLETELKNRKEFTDKLYSIFSSILGEPQDNSTTNVFDIINCGMYTYI